MRNEMATAPDVPQHEQTRGSALMGVSAEEHDGMRRQLEQPDVEQVERLRRFLAATPSPRRA